MVMGAAGWASELFTAVPAVNSAWSRACASACAFAAAASRSALVVDATSPFSFDPIAAGGSATLLVPVFTTTASAVTVSIVPHAAPCGPTMVAPAPGLVTCAAIAVRPGAYSAAAGDTTSHDGHTLRAGDNLHTPTPQVLARCAWELVSLAYIPS